MGKILIKGMSCRHCVMATTKALQEVEGLADIDVNLEKGEATFSETKPVDSELIKEKVKKAGYEVVEVVQ
jgi:copper chaperone